MVDLTPLILGKVSEDSEEGASLLSEGVSDFNNFLETHPQTNNVVLEIIDANLKKGIKATTFKVLQENLDKYLGKDLSNIIWMYVLFDKIKQDIDKSLSPAADNFLRTILSLHGQELKASYDWFTHQPNDWSMFNREVYYDYINQTYLIRVKLEKYNGEETVIEGPPNNILALITRLIRTINIINNRDAFNKIEINEFLEAEGQLIKLLMPDKLENVEQSLPTDTQAVKDT